jgi:hypothetical protein
MNKDKQNDVTRAPTQSLLDEQRSESEGMGQPQQIDGSKPMTSAAGSEEAKNGGTTAELFALEKQYWQALKDNDLEAALRLTDEPCIVTGAQGVMRLDKATLRKMFASDSQVWQLRSFELGDPEVRMLANDVAILAYKVHEEVVVEGKTLTLDANDASTWIRRNGAWVCALHTEALAGDPFGRDRMARP